MGIFQSSRGLDRTRWFGSVMHLPTIDNWGDLRNKRVLVRVDFNCPVAEIGGELTVTDDFRIRSTLPLLKELLNRGAEVTCMTHFGRPEGKVVDAYSVRPIKKNLDRLISGVNLLENLRFNPGEEANNPAFGAALCQGFDFYVNEAFGASHRSHASIVQPPLLLPSAAGPNLCEEVSTLLGALDSPTRPFVAIVGGAKIKEKLGITRVLAQKADSVIVGGGMAYTFQVAQGRTIGDSLFNESFVGQCEELLKGTNVVIPVDARALETGKTFGVAGGDDPSQVFEGDIPAGFEGLDIGPKSVELFKNVIESAKTILWNGPMGVFEDPRFASGTREIAEAVANSSAFTVIGGGDSVAAINSYQLEDKVDFISTGGGASLELVEFGDLPGLKALRECKLNSMNGAS
jgi:phosphoglycerate kinase